MYGSTPPPLHPPGLLHFFLFSHPGNLRSSRIFHLQRRTTEGEVKLGCVYTIYRIAFLLQIPIRIVSLHFRDLRGAASLDRNRDETTLLMCEQTPYRYGCRK